MPVFDDASGKFLGYRATGAYVTRQHSAERAGRQTSAELEQAMEALTAHNAQLDLALEDARAGECAKIAFLAMMSHELRTPLNQASRRAGEMESWLQDVVRSASDWIWATDHNLSFVSAHIAETTG